ALLRELGVAVVTRLHQCRPHDFQRGRDRLITWMRPERHDWMDEATYERMPPTLSLREVHVQVNQPGFRVDSLIVVTTLTDADTYASADIAELYHQRWLVELDIRVLKITLNMDVL